MAGIGNNLYPPIIPTWMPSFVRTAECRVYFSLSSYNSAAEIKYVQVIVSNQNSSLSALDPSQYPASIKIAVLNVDTDQRGDSKYYITIKPNDLQEGIFEIGQYYKVQLRFTGAEATSLDMLDDGTLRDPSQIAKWLSENEAFFSEWSTVCLIKGIEQPKIYLKGFEDIGTTATQTFSSEVVELVGDMYYDENGDIEDEYLKYYEVNIYNNSTELLVYESGIVYTNEFYPNEINYTLKTNLSTGLVYRLELIYTTNNGYTGTSEYLFSTISASNEDLDAVITSETDEENGRILIHVLGNSTGAFFGNLCIRRSSNEDNYVTWEDIKIVTLQDGHMLDCSWYDYTVKSGVYYRYCAQKIDTKGHRGTIITTRTPVMIYLNDMFLTREDMQLRVRYDPSISSMKVNYSESKTETIGSKYPFIRRNGNVAYKSFPISGLITSFCDSDNLFSSREEFYGDDVERYDLFNEEEQITEYKDFIYEREFREKIMNFLHGNDVKLFRSLTEGNVLVRLMDISFTPNATLGRMLYSFSATAYEIDECSIDNYNKYGILSTGEYQSYIEYDYYETGQINETVSAGLNILIELQDKATVDAADGFDNIIQYLTWVRIEFQGDPYLIECGADGSLTIITNPQEATDNTVYGYIVYINGEGILVSPRGYFELDDVDTKVTSIYFPVDTEVIIDYTAYINEVEDSSLIASRLYNYIKVGQLWGTFDVDTSISMQLYSKYYLDYTTYYQHLTSIDGITVEAEPGSIVYIKDSFDDDYYRHEIGSTGVLRFYDEEATISAFYFCGVHLNEMQDYERLEAEDWEYRETGIEVDTVDEITNPVKNGVYQIDTPIYVKALDFDGRTVTVNEEDTIFEQDIKQYTLILQDLASTSGGRYIYYRDDWYVFTEDNIALCPVEGIVDYTFEVLRGEY